jgi:hypothetical protein
MANSSLQGQSAPVHDKVKKHLNIIFNAYKGNKTVEGYSRLKNLVDSNEISYEQLKRIKNFFDSFSGDVNDTPYLLNGGTMMKKWVDYTLDKARKGLEGKKKAMSDVGMDNQYIKNHSKDGVRIDPHDSDTNKILRQEGIYNIGIMESLIKTIDKNKELWHKHHGNQSRLY